MIKKLLLSTILAGTLIGSISASDEPKVVEGKIDAIASIIEKKFGGQDKDGNVVPERGARETAERLLMAFYLGGKAQDGEFDTVKGLTAARDGLQVAAGEMFAVSMFKKFLEEHPEIGSQFFRAHSKIWAKLGLDFFLKGVKYANGSDREKSFVQYLKNEFFPHFVRKSAVYWSFQGLKSNVPGLLNQYAPNYANALIRLHKSSLLIPFIGVLIEDAPEDMMLKPLYDSGLEKAKDLAAIIKSKMATAPQAALAA